MQLDEGGTITLADFTGPAADEGGGQYEQFVSPFAPDHDPFTDYPGEPADVDVTPSLSPFAVTLAVPTTLAHNLDVRRQKVWACWGKTVVVGWIGDAAHQAECSDHNPDSAAVVHAIDPMVTGDRAQAIVGQCLADSGDLQYVIHNGVIWSVTTGWVARKYLGSDPHTSHVHISGRHGLSHRNGATCTGYDLNAEAVTPGFDLCPPPPSPTPVPVPPPVPAPVPKPPAPRPPVHAPGTRVLEPHNPDLTGDDVEFVQRFIGVKRCGAPDGDYGPRTTAGVRWYQDMRGIRVDGRVGKVTWGQMGVRWRG